MGILGDIILIAVILAVVVFLLWAAIWAIGGFVSLFYYLTKGTWWAIGKLRQGNPLLFIIILCIGLIVLYFTYSGYHNDIESRVANIEFAQKELDDYEKGVPKEVDIFVPEDSMNSPAYMSKIDERLNKEREENIRHKRKFIKEEKEDIENIWHEYLPGRIVGFSFTGIGLTGILLIVILRLGNGSCLHHNRKNDI